MDGYDAAFITFGGVFLLVALISYSWEIWERTPWDTVHKSILKLVFRRKQGVTKQPPVDRVDAEGDVKAHPTTPSGRNLNWRRWLTWLPAIFWFLSLIPVFLFYRESGTKGETLLNISSPGWGDDALHIEPDIGGKYTERLNLSVTISDN